ncbi:hypothetical protein [Streptomyces sp. NBC_00829]|uniref:hypothetical protein n=1 Tax=Streptomyces sp. NBC_00829 TaxID=2903679 RepID=UPI00386F3A0C|nr:hypothetical protein OG293_32935 [Streptomyces sp. NBC_00829]
MIRNTTGQTAIHLEYRWPSAWTRLAAHLDFATAAVNEAGNRVLLVPVEMRGYAFEGAISEGDWVRAHGKMKRGTLRASKVENLTSGAGVNAKTTPKGCLIAFAVVFAAVLAFLIWGFFTQVVGR